MSLRVPPFLADHPVESLMAAMLLLGLLFIAADGTNPLADHRPLLLTAQRN